MTTETLEINGQPAEAHVITLPACNLVFITKGNALLACGAVDVDALDKFGLPAIKVTGVSTPTELLDGEVKAVNQTAAARGAHVGQTGRDALTCC